MKLEEAVWALVLVSWIETILILISIGAARRAIMKENRELMRDLIKVLMEDDSK